MACGLAHHTPRRKPDERRRDTSMRSEARLGEVRQSFDPETWKEGYARGYIDGHLDGEYLGEQALRDRLLRHLARVACDLRLGLQHDMETPLQVLHAIDLLVQDRSQT
jgi:hypothetical protein